MSPQRIQRKRTLGSRMPEGAVYVGRPSRWGNPFRYLTHAGLARVPAIDGSPWEYEGRISAAGTRHDCFHPDGMWTRHTVRHMTRAECVEMFELALTAPTSQIHLWLQKERRWLTVDDARAELAGKDLACWCPLEQSDGTKVPCHVDVLLRVANGGAA